ncbi:STAS domain-containing protein [Streptomyces sp. NPDC087440]|uniref:STAS domain-containing protein n=1 Tax=Streptomyces sp. NPDC087440 TaxID=3365790 RepID=UPI0037F4BD4B
MSGNPLDVTARQTENRATGVRETVLEFSGDCDFVTAELLRAAVLDVLPDLPRGSELTLDLSGVGLFDSSGLSALIMAHRHTTRAGVALALRGAGDHLLRILDITGVAAHFAATRAAVAAEAEREPRPSAASAD